MWLCVDHYQSAGWVSGCTHTRAHSALLYPAVFVGARIVGEDVPRRQRYCSCLPLISSPSLPLPSPGARTANKDILLPYLEAICGVRGDDE